MMMVDGVMVWKTVSHPDIEPSETEADDSNDETYYPDSDESSSSSAEYKKEKTGTTEIISILSFVMLV